MDDTLWKAIVECETRFDGTYYYAVQTTGIFCRPSCKSRVPRRANVQIFPSAAAAEAAGFRPCKRCHPNDDMLTPDVRMVEEVKSVLEQRLSQTLTLTDLSQIVSVSPYHLHRVFRRVTGMTPLEYALRRKILEARALLGDSARTVTDVGIRLGFRTLSHFSTVFRRYTGVSPSEYRRSQQQPLREASR